MLESITRWTQLCMPPKTLTECIVHEPTEELGPEAKTISYQVLELKGANNQYFYNESDLLGEGSFGRVYLGSVGRDGKKCAVKHVPKANPLLVATSLAEFANKLNKHVEILRQEMHTLKAIAHPNIITLVDYTEDFRNFYLVLEYCAGGKLKQFITDRRNSPSFTESDASHILQHVLDALQYLHGKKFCHRDVKPDNVILQDRRPIAQNNAKLIDFGLACECRPGEWLRERVGTLAFMAPQVVECCYDLSADMWSCGVMMFQLLSGKLPFSASTNEAVMNQVRRGNFALHGDEWSCITDNAKDLIRGLMKYDAQDRWKAAEAVHHTWIKHHAPGSSSRNLAQGNWRI